jgi:hypothetical protein
MSAEETAALIAVLLLATSADEPQADRQRISPWAEAARDYADADPCSPRF